MRLYLEGNLRLKKTDYQNNEDTVMTKYKTSFFSLGFKISQGIKINDIRM